MVNPVYKLVLSYLWMGKIYKALEKISLLLLFPREDPFEKEVQQAVMASRVTNNTANNAKKIIFCPKCKATFKSENKLAVHQNSSTKVCIWRDYIGAYFSCFFCHQKCDSPYVLSKHYIRVHMLTDRTGRPLSAQEHPAGEEYVRWAKKYLSPDLAIHAFGNEALILSLTNPPGETNGPRAAAPIILPDPITEAFQSPTRVITSENVAGSSKRAVFLERQDKPHAPKPVFICEACDFNTTDVALMRAHRWSHSVEGEIEGVGGRLNKKFTFGGTNPGWRISDLYSRYLEDIPDAADSDDQAASDVRRLAGRLSLNRKLALLRSSHSGAYKMFRYIFPESVNYPDSAFVNVQSEIIRVLSNEVAANKGKPVKTMAALFIEMIKLDEFLNITDEIIVPFRSDTLTIFPRDKVAYSEIVAAFKEKIETSIEVFVNRGSGWTIR